MKKVVYVLLAVLLLCGLVSAGYIVNKSMEAKELSSEEKLVNLNTFEKMFEEIDVLKTVPIMEGEGIQVGSATDYGGGTYMVDVNGTTLEHYYAYLTELKEQGFTQFVTSDENGLYGSAYNAVYTKDDVVVSVVQLTQLEKTYISATYDLPLSDHLHYKEEYVANNIEGAKTSVSMMELYDFGNSFVIQLKNGHFIVNDGGVKEDAPYLIEYLETLAPEGQKPIVEAWIISHPHQDHLGVLQAFIDNPKYAERLLVDGVYYNETSNKTFAQMNEPGLASVVTQMKMAIKMFKTSQGTIPKIYRPQTGQRYYFCDITIDILFTQEQLHLDNYNNDINDSSTWCVYNIEGQRFLLAGDADDGSMNTVMRAYKEEDMKMDIMAVFHHGLNVRDVFTDFCDAKTVLYTTWKTENFSHIDYYKRVEENKYLQASATEFYTWKDGTVFLEFPYKVGTVKILPEIEWIYNDGVDKRGNK